MISRLGFTTMPLFGLGNGNGNRSGAVRCLPSSATFSPPGRGRRLRGGVVLLVASADVGANHSSVNLRTGEELRAQLDQLHAEAEATRSKANSARLRLMRLSEVTEQLQRQAARNVRIGKEDDARELLVQKQKVMNALEKSKNRIELLDELSTKLNKAISLKETELIGNVASHSSIGSEDTATPVWIVSPKVVLDEDFEENGIHEPPDQKLEEMESQSFEASGSLDYMQPITGAKPSTGTESGSKINILRNITSYKGLLEHVDGQLKGVENDLLAVLRLSSLVMEDEQKQKNTSMQQTLEILENISNIRERIATIIQSKTGER